MLKRDSNARSSGRRLREVTSAWRRDDDSEDIDSETRETSASRTSDASASGLDIGEVCMTCR